jgi:hypothetical protein
LSTKSRETRTQVASIAAILPHLATKDDATGVRIEVSELRTEVAAIAAVMPHLATKADLTAVRVEVAVLGTRIITWGVATAIALTSLAFTIARFVH